jgi:hypothetical protein
VRPVQFLIVDLYKLEPLIADNWSQDSVIVNWLINDRRLGAVEKIGRPWGESLRGHNRLVAKAHVSRRPLTKQAPG